MLENKRDHWEKIYASRKPEELSWTEEVPRTSLEFIHSFHLDKTAAIIDIGGGESKLVDHLLDEGFENVTVLDISEKALERAKKRLGDRSAKVKWIVADVNEFEPKQTYDVWHDRAAFHFLTTTTEINKYLQTATNAVKGYLTLATFSEKGPKKCSGLNVKQYSEEQLQATLSGGFEKIKCITEDHTTPFNTSQNFLVCSFKKRKQAV